MKESIPAVAVGFLQKRRLLLCAGPDAVACRRLRCESACSSNDVPVGFVLFSDVLAREGFTCLTLKSLQTLADLSVGTFPRVLINGSLFLALWECLTCKFIEKSIH